VSRRRRVVFVVVAGLVAGTIAWLADPSGSAGALVYLATGLVVGELLELRLENGTAVPLSYAVLIVLASSFHAPAYVLAVAGAEAISAVLRVADGASSWRVHVFAERLLVAAATLAAYDGVRALVRDRERIAWVLCMLGAAAVAQVGVDLAARWALRLAPTWSRRARLAWLAIASSGLLMAIAYRGVGGRGRVGLLGPLLFSTPLLAAWYAFERLDSATRAYRQTVEALAMAPEFGGIVPPGHSQRVAALSVAMAIELGVPASDVGDLEMAALLHHLGQVTLDEPPDGVALEAARVAAVTGTMLREIKPLAAAGDIVAGDVSEPRRRVAVHVLRIASDYDDLTARDGNDAGVAIETLRSAPGYVYDDKTLDALERVVAAGRPGHRPLEPA